MTALIRCAWCGDDPLYQDYHDNEWGRPQWDDSKLFEMLILEGAQAGLSWITILRKREGYRKAFHHFNPEAVASMTEEAVQALLQNPDIIRNRLKIQSTLTNARVFLAMQQQHGSFAKWLWSYVDGKPIVNAWQHHTQAPAKTPLSDKISRDLKKAGMKFVGSTTIYAYMQASGLVNDHIQTCAFYKPE